MSTPDLSSIDPLVHVGYHKTGTTWLQYHLFGIRDNGFQPLAPSDVADPKKAAKYLSYLFFMSPDGTLLPPFESRSSEIRQFLNTICPLDSGVPVVSSERLSGNPHSAGFDSTLIAGRLAEVFPRARILIVIREQKAMLLSTYFQYLKIGGTLSLQGYLHKSYDGRLPFFSLSFLEYDRLISYYQELFSPERVLVLPYELFADNPAQFVAKIARFAGANIPQDLPFDDTPNKGLPKIVEYYSRLLNLFAFSSSANGFSPLCIPGTRNRLRSLRRIIARLVPRSQQQRFNLKMRAYTDKAVGTSFAASNLRTSQLTGLPLREWGYDVIA